MFSTPGRSVRAMVKGTVAVMVRFSVMVTPEAGVLILVAVVVMENVPL